MLPDDAPFYVRPLGFTDPHEYAPALDSLPAESRELSRILNELLLHVWKVDAFYAAELAGSKPNHNVGTRNVRALIAKIVSLNPAPLTHPRPVTQRAIVDCRQFAVLMCAVLRHKGIPARARCGFADYLAEGHYHDHWVCEWWNETENRWVLTDADTQKDDLPRDAFYPGLEAWERGQEDADFAHRCGYGGGLLGLYLVRNNALRDFAALCGWESVSGDSWGGVDYVAKAVSASEHAVLNHMATLARNNNALRERLYLFAANPLVAVPDVVNYYDYVRDLPKVAQKWVEVP